MAYNWFIISGTELVDVEDATIVFSGSSSNINAAINVDEYNAGTFLGTDDPGDEVDQAQNVAYVSDTEFSHNGGTTYTINNTNLQTSYCTIAIEYHSTTSYQVTAGAFYSFRSSISEGTPAFGVHCYAVEANVGATEWDMINDSSLYIGGSANGLALHTQSGATYHTFFIAISAQPESIGMKTDFDFGIALTLV
jgi:hypothetical protein